MYSYYIVIQHFIISSEIVNIRTLILLNYNILAKFAHSFRGEYLENNTYKAAGVDIEAGDETVRRIKGLARSTFNSSVLSDLGLFGGFFEPNFSNIKNPVLVSSVDGVGTKLKIAIEMEKHYTIGQDLVNHCVNDIAVCGAKPLFFLDYLAFGKLDPSVAEMIISGFAVACKYNGCALIGGETAEMPGVYSEKDYDISGTIVGVVDKSKIINGKSISKGDILVGYSSNGLHTNGYSLARKILLDKFKLTDHPEGLEFNLGEELLRVHKSYLSLITALSSEMTIKGLSHITGGGIVGNTKRIIPEGLTLDINWNAWEVPALFKLIQNTGSVPDEEMRKVFNIGIGLVAVINEVDFMKLTTISEKLSYKPVIIGKVV